MRFRRRAERSDALPLPGAAWGTKGIEFWTFLSLLLLRAGSRRILELGAGRSTITFAEYAHCCGAHLVSLETSTEWYNKVRLDLRCLALPVDVVKRVEIDERTGWYRRDPFRSQVAAAAPYDCILIDAPNDPQGDSRGMRDAPEALAELSSVCRGAELVLVDDVHRRHVFDTIEQVLDDPASYDTWFYDYPVLPSHPNALSISARSGSRAAASIPQIQQILGLELTAGRSRDRCPEP